jgi:hypothetical protein
MVTLYLLKRNHYQEALPQKKELWEEHNNIIVLYKLSEK